MGYPTPIHVSMPVIDVFVQKIALPVDIVCLLVSLFFLPRDGEVVRNEGKGWVHRDLLGSLVKVFSVRSVFCHVVSVLQPLFHLFSSLFLIHVI